MSSRTSAQPPRVDEQREHHRPAFVELADVEDRGPRTVQAGALPVVETFASPFRLPVASGTAKGGTRSPAATPPEPLGFVAIVLMVIPTRIASASRTT